MERAPFPSNEQYRLLFEKNPLPMWIYDRETLGFLEVNEAALRQYGYSREELAGMTISDIRPSEDVPALLSHIPKDDVGLTDSGIWRHRRKDGRILHVQIISHTLRFQDRDAELVMALDVTERVGAENELRLSEERFSKAFRAAPHPLTITTLADGRFIDVNDSFLTITGYTRDEILQTTSRDIRLLVDPKFRDHLVESLRSHGRARNLETQIRTRSGEVRDFVVSAEIVRLGGEECLLAVSDDVTERKLGEKGLRRSEARTRAVLESALDCIISIDHEGRILDWNPAAERTFGYSRDQVLGSSMADLIIPPHLRGQHQEGLARYLAGGESRVLNKRLEMTALRADGTEFPMELAIAQAGIEGPPVFTAYLRDITDRLRSEQELRSARDELERRVQERTAQLDAANKELEAFSYSVSHDLRAPLRAIDGFGHALLEDYGEKLDDRGRDYLDRVRGAAQRMGLLIEAMLMLSRTTRAEMRRERVDMSALASAVSEELRRLDPERQVKFVLQEGVAAQGDPQLLKIVLENLLQNAWKFTSRHASARIEFGSIDRDGRQVHYVRDDGAGFDMRYVDKLFGPFQRVHRTSEFSGTGIGLATVYRIVQRHGGTIWAEGEVERGATFYFTLLS